MAENLYLVTPNILYEIATYAREHPDMHFVADELSDEEGDFLSCGFLHDDPMRVDESPIWELNGTEEK